MTNIVVPFFVANDAVFRLSSLVRDTRAQLASSVSLTARVALSGEPAFLNVVQLLSSFASWEKAGVWKTVVRFSSGSHVCEGSLNATVLYACDRIRTDSDVAGKIRIASLKIDAPGEISCVLPTEVSTGFERSFVYQGWRYTVSKMWTGKTLVEAQNNMEQADSNFRFMASVCKDNANEYIRKNSNSYVACSILLKISSMFAHQLRIELNRNNDDPGNDSQPSIQSDAAGSSVPRDDV